MKRRRQLSLQTLEQRDVPATFGIPWSDPRNLTISFAPDNTRISSAKSSLFQTLNSQYGVNNWQPEILRALQSWSSVTNIDVGFVADHGYSFGSSSGEGAGRVTGDLRVGAAPLSNSALAIGLPPDPFFGDYWSGEVVLNSAQTLDPSKASLYSVFAHEFGHAFGLPSSSDSTSIMYNQATTPGTSLSAIDIASIQALYGVRQPDIHDAEENNGTFANATDIEYESLPPGATSYTGQYPLIAFGDMTTLNDVDIYDVETPVTYSGAVTFRLQSRGLSLLAPKLSIYTRSGQFISSNSSTDPTGSIVTLQLKNAPPDTHYYVKVEGATEDIFGIGRYGLAVTFNAAVQPIYVRRTESILVGPHHNFDEDDIDVLMVNPSLAYLNYDEGTNETLATAFTLPAIGKTYDTFGSIEFIGDIDNYRVRTPQQVSPPVLTISVGTELTNSVIPKIQLVSSTGQVLPTSVLFNGDGRLTVQSSFLTPNTDYFVRVQSSANNLLGNYSLKVLSGSTLTQPQSFLTGRVSFMPVETPLTVVQNQVFHFMLDVKGSPTAGIRMTIENAQGLVYDLTVFGGSVANNRPVLLQPGTYTIRFTRVGTAYTGVPFTLWGAVLSDPIGPGANDPTQNPAGPEGNLATYYLGKLKGLAGRLKSEVG